MKERATGQVKVQVIDREGQMHILAWNPDQVLMEAIRDNNLPVVASCGGNCACATCHVHVAEQDFKRLPPRQKDELDMLQESRAFWAEASRLSCQIRFSPNHDGLTVTLAPYD